MNTPLDPAAKKAYEVGYALFRVAAILPSRHLAELLEKEALELLRTTVGNLPTDAARTLRTLNYMVSFGKDTGNIHPENGELLVRQLDALSGLLHDSAKNEITPADLDDIFSQDTRPTAPVYLEAAPHTKRTTQAGQDRQEIILQKIRQSGNCRTRDIQAALPDLSERTLRYDLQRLVEQGKIERGGSGGPDSWYRTKDAAGGTPSP
jgi:hypothetical protein